MLSVAGRVRYELDASIDYPRQFVGDVAVRLADGRCSASGRITRAAAPTRR